jgi:hypothetical protein
MPTKEYQNNFFVIYRRIKKFENYQSFETDVLFLSAGITRVSVAKYPIPPGNSLAIVKFLTTWGDLTESKGTATLKVCDGYQKIPFPYDNEASSTVKSALERSIRLILASL